MFAARCIRIETPPSRRSAASHYQWAPEDPIPWLSWIVGSPHCSSAPANWCLLCHQSRLQWHRRFNRPHRSGRPGNHTTGYRQCSAGRYSVRSRRTSARPRSRRIPGNGGRSRCSRATPRRQAETTGRTAGSYQSLAPERWPGPGWPGPVSPSPKYPTPALYSQTGSSVNPAA